MNVLQFIQQNDTEVLDLEPLSISGGGAFIALAVSIGIPLGILITAFRR